MKSHGINVNRYFHFIKRPIKSFFFELEPKMLSVILYVQEVLPNISNLLYIMGNYFLGTQ